MGWQKRVLALFIVAMLMACSPLVAPSGRVEATAAPDRAAERFGPWQIVEVSRPASTALLQADGDAFRLDPAWEVASLTWVDKWWGLGTPQFNLSRIERTGEGFMREGKAVPAEQVQALLDAMGGFYRTQFELSGQGHTDDYPSRLIELVGSDGQRLVLTSESTDNPGNGPWNLSFNGETWAQFDGSLWYALQPLFYPEADPEAAFTDRRGDPWTHSSFSTTGAARQDIEGLLEVRDSFYYRASEDGQGIEGYIEGRSSIAQIGHMVIGTFNELTEVLLTLPDGTERPCPSERLPTDDPAGDAWTFTCPLGESAAATGFYRLPLRLTFGTTEGDRITTTGALVGSWEAFRLDDEAAALLDTPLPQWLTAALSSNEQGATMLASHRPIAALYSGEMPADQPPSAGEYSGEIIWAGWREAKGRQIPYTVDSLFAYQGGQLTEWSLSADKSVALADAVLAQPLTQRLLAELPTLRLNLWYGEHTPPDEDGRSLSVTVGACEGLPGPATLPSRDEPLRAFGFNGDGSQGWGFLPFVLLDERAVVSDLDFWMGESLTPVDEALLPALFRDGPAFERIRLSSSDYFTERPTMSFSVADDFPTDQLAPYNAFIESLPATANNEYGTIWELSNLTLAVDERGYLILHDCDPDP